MASLSKTEVDRLGDRLRKGSLTEADLRMLDEYRRQFGEAYDHVVRVIRGRLGLEPTGRPAKSTTSLVEKLRRESIRLSQVQDIAGCRIIVDDVVEQDATIHALLGEFGPAIVTDRRGNPSHGYRAVHVIPRISTKLVEIQVRTLLQHVWAELSEKLSDLFDPQIKYGGGSEELQRMLMLESSMLATIEELESDVAILIRTHEDEKVLDLRGRITRQRESMSLRLKNMVAFANDPKRRQNDLSS